MTFRKCIFVLCLLSLSLTITSSAQENAELTRVVVTYPNSAILPGATISLIKPAVGEVRRTVTDSAGIYTFTISASKSDVRRSIF
jgi:hypothetical protein